MSWETGLLGLFSVFGMGLSALIQSIFLLLHDLTPQASFRAAPGSLLLPPLILFFFNLVSRSPSRPRGTKLLFLPFSSPDPGLAFQLTIVPLIYALAVALAVNARPRGSGKEPRVL